MLQSDVPGTMQIRRFADLSGVELGSLASDQAAAVTVPAGDVTDPWQLTSDAPVRACPPG